MFVYPHIDRIAFEIGPIKVYWYGIIYAVSIIGAWFLGVYRAAKPNSGWTREQVSDLIFCCAIGAVVGGRVGYVLIYDLMNFVANPLILFETWHGGMSFHGGILGVVIGMLLFAKKRNKNFFDLGDFVAPLVPLGLAAGRIGNFINGELWGRVTTMPWGMIYPRAGSLPRHPSELYESFLEGLILFIIVWWFSMKPKPRAAVSALFLLCYGCFRFFLEFFRQPDPQLGFIAFGWLTMGQFLSIPMIVLGAVLLVWAYKKNGGNNHV